MCTHLLHQPQSRLHAVGLKLTVNQKNTFNYEFMNLLVRISFPWIVFLFQSYNNFQERKLYWLKNYCTQCATYNNHEL
jgi:hypothetical protein